MRAYSYITISCLILLILISSTYMLSTAKINARGEVFTQRTQGLIKRSRTMSPMQRYTAPRTQPRTFNGILNVIVSWGDDTASRASLDSSNLQTIVTGGAHHLAINNNGSVTSWGSNSKGQRNIPATLVNAQDETVDLAAGDLHSAAIINSYDDEGFKHTFIKVWGDNSKGQQSVPLKLTNDSATPLAIAAGANHTIAYSTEYDPPTGTEIVAITSWGNNSTASVPDALRPIDPIHEGVQQLMANGNHNAVLFGDGGIYEWYTTGNATARLADANTRYTKIAVGENHLLAITEQKLLVGWGDNSKGQLAIPAGVTCWDEVVSGNNHVIAIDCTGTVYAWGNNTKGQTTIPALAKEHISKRTQLVAYGDHTVLMYQVEPTYELVRWGANPNNLPTIRTDIQYMVAGVNHALAVISDSTVIAWGDNSEGQSTVPSTLTDVYSIANGTYHSMAIDTSGTIWAWGSNKSGQLNIPANLGQVVDITAGRDFSIAYSITDTGALDNNGNPLSTNLVTLWGGNSKKTLPTIDLNNIMSIKCYDNHCVAMVAGSTVVDGITISQNYLVDWVYTNDLTGAKTVTIRKPPSTDYRYLNYAVGGSHTLVMQSYDHIDSNTGEMTYNTKVVGFLNPGASNVGQTAEQTIPADSDVNIIAAGATHSVLLTTDDKLTIWGSNSANERITPNYIVHVMGIVAGSNYNLAIAFVDRSRLPNTATATRTATVSKTATATRSATRTRSSTLTRTNTLTMTATRTRTITRTRTNTSTMTATRTRTITRTPTSTRTRTSTMTASKTSTATATRTATRTATPSRTPRP